MQRNTYQHQLYQSATFHQQQTKFLNQVDAGVITSFRKQLRNSTHAAHTLIKVPSCKSTLMAKAIFYMYVLNLAVQCAEVVANPQQNFISNDNYASNAITSSKSYKNYPAEIIDSNVVCRKKTQGLSAGVICKLDGANHLLKPLDSKDTNYQNIPFDFRQVLINKKLLQYIGITTPDLKIVYKEGGEYQMSLNEHYSHFKTGKANYFLASQWVNNFMTFSDWFAQPVNQLNYDKELVNTPDPFTLNTLTAEKILKKSDFSKLLVASSLVDDILSNGKNWGVDKNGLVIVDMDLMHHQPSVMVTSFLADLKNYQTGLSLKHLKQMLAIYNKLLTMELPQEPGYKSISPEDFTLVLTVYRDTCQQLIAKAKEFNIDNLPRRSTTAKFNSTCKDLFNSYIKERENKRHLKP